MHVCTECDRVPHLNVQLYPKWLEIRQEKTYSTVLLQYSTTVRSYQNETNHMYYIPQDATFENRTKFLCGPHWGPQNPFLATMGLETSSFHNGLGHHGKTPEY